MKHDELNLSLETLAIHAGQEPDPMTGAVMMPITLASTFAQESPSVHRGYEYSRTLNPTRHALENCLKSIEYGRFAYAFASGSATTATLLHTLSPGDHILSGDDVYGGTFRLFDKVIAKMGISASYIDMTDLKHVERSIQSNTKMIWMETPTNPMLKIFDIAAIATIAKKANAKIIVDNTFATPLLQHPLNLGATAVVHSTTKYINGHSDVVGGAYISNDESLSERVQFLQNSIGAVPSPFDCYMVLRGLKTLGVRVRAQCASAQTIAERLSSRKDIEIVYYPGLQTHRGHDLAKAQMNGLFGGMISFVVRGGFNTAKTFLENLNIISCAESLGGVESLAEHPASMTHASVPAETRRALGIADGLVRLSVGLEATDDLWADIVSALEKASHVK